MKLLFIFLLSVLYFSNCQGQSKKIDTSTIWTTLYPDNNNFDDKKRLLTKVDDDEGKYEYRTEVGKIFYYKVGTQQKALVILFTYDFSHGFKLNCHPCHPFFEMAYFVYSNGEWKKQKFIQDWTGSTGSWGEPAEIKYTVFNKTKCIVTRLGYTNQGNGETTIVYYNMETLKEVKVITMPF